MPGRRWSIESLRAESLANVARARDRNPQARGVRMFTVDRASDASGTSGTGVVVEGVVFSDGRVANRWVTDKPGSTCTWDSLEDFLAIHCDSHPTNKTVLTWDDGSVTRH